MNSRRDFIKKTSAFTALGMLSNWALASSLSDKFGHVLPTRRLLRTGEKVTTFCLGGFHVGKTDDPSYAEKLLDKSIELGVRFFDNARGYHDGRSEEYYGRFLNPKYRDKIFLMTKSPAKNAKKAREHLEESLKAFNTDVIDLWQMHNLLTPEDVDNRVNNGVLDVFLEAKEQGKVKHIGFTTHRNPKTPLYYLDFLEERGLKMETCQMPVNVCDASFESFQNQVLPVLLEKEYGVIAMKTMAGGSMLGKRIDITPEHIKTEDIPDVSAMAGITLEELHQFVYSLPVSSLCSGCETLEQLEYNVRVLDNYKKLTEAQMDRLIKMAKPHAGLNVENYQRVLS